MDGKAKQNLNFFGIPTIENETESQLKQTPMKNLLTFIFLTISVSSFGQTEKQIDRLKDFYIKATTNTDSLNFQTQFFNTFPSSFKEFNNTFGYFNNEDPHLAYAGALYFESEKYLNLFFRMTTVPDTAFYKKIIGIAIGGHWDADAINYFQAGLRKKVFTNPKLAFDILKNKSNKDIKSFFFFFFQRVHPIYKTIPDELIKMKSYDSKIYGLMEKELETSIKKK